MIILRSLLKDFLTKIKITTQNHQSAHKLKYETFTSHESKASQLAKKIRRYSHCTKHSPLFPLYEKISRRTRLSIRYGKVICESIKNYDKRIK